MVGLNEHEQKMLRAIKERDIQATEFYWDFWEKLYPHITVEDFKFLKNHHNEFSFRYLYLNIAEGAYKRNLDLYEFLVKNNCFGHTLGDDRTPVIMFVVERTQSLEKVINLVDMGINLNMVDKKGRNLLFYARSEKIFDYLVSKGLDLKCVDDKGNTVLHHFMEINQPLYNCLVPLVNIGNNKKQTPLMISHHKSQMESLLKSGADLNQVDNMERTALFYFYTEEVINLLISHGADINHQDKKGNTFLMRELTRKYATTELDEQAFSSHYMSININAQNREGETLLMLCLKQFGGEVPEKDIVSLAEKIINHPRLNLEIKDKEGKTALDYATEHGALKTYMQILLTKKNKECRLAI